MHLLRVLLLGCLLCCSWNQEQKRQNTKHTKHKHWPGPSRCLIWYLRMIVHIKPNINFNRQLNMSYIQHNNNKMNKTSANENHKQTKPNNKKHTSPPMLTIFSPSLLMNAMANWQFSCWCIGDLGSFFQPGCFVCCELGETRTTEEANKPVIVLPEMISIKWHNNTPFYTYSTTPQHTCISHWQSRHCEKETKQNLEIFCHIFTFQSATQITCRHAQQSQGLPSFSKVCVDPSGERVLLDVNPAPRSSTSCHFSPNISPNTSKNGKKLFLQSTQTETKILQKFNCIRRSLDTGRSSSQTRQRLRKSGRKIKTRIRAHFL